MQRATRLRLDTVRRILEFCRRHPGAASPTITKIVARLERLSRSVRTRLDQQLIWQQEISDARAERDHRAHALRPRLIGLIRLADAAAEAAGDPALRLTESRLAASTSPGPFLQHAGAVLEAARARSAALIDFGMPPELLGQVRNELADCAAAHTRILELGTKCTAAGAELDAIASQALQTLRHLDALNALRFAANPIMLEEWERTAAVAWPGSRQPTAIPAHPLVRAELELHPHP